MDTLAFIEGHYMRERERGLNGAQSVGYMEREILAEGMLWDKWGLGCLYAPRRRGREEERSAETA
jgi:hypothetical protein